MAGNGQETVRELRLAVVCFGGVSLAIYMHGITRELQNLVLASAAFDDDPDGENPFAGGTEAVYWDVLRRLRAEAGGGLKPRVVVDILAGTSAGGLNAVFLAKALARGCSQEPLKRLWFDRGDVRALLRGPARLPLVLRVPWVAATSAWSLVRHRTMPALLRGDAMCRWLHQALQEMGDRPLPAPAPGRLVPRGVDLQLFVPVTDFYGYRRDIPLRDPASVTDRTHRHIIEFRLSDGRRDDFTGEDDHVLAFAARATSSFPATFSPVRFEDYEAAFDTPPGLQARAAQFFPFHTLAGVAPGQAHFIDGGVLDNFPFRAAVDAVVAKPAGHEVDRRLLYIEPDPSETETAGGGPSAPPGFLRTVFGGYAGIPRKEPILDDLIGLARRNEEVRRLRDVIEAGFGSIRERVEDILGAANRSGLPEEPSPEQLAAGRAAVEDRALAEAGFAAGTYLRTRLRTMVDSYGDAIARARSFPPGSLQADFVHRAVHAWAVADELFVQSPDAEQAARQRRFLAHLDVAYHVRRVEFLVAAVNWLYDEAGRPGRPGRGRLDAAKEELYTLVASLRHVLDDLAAEPDVAKVIDDVFRDEEVAGAAGGDGVDRFLERHRPELTRIRRYVAATIGGLLPDVERRLHRAVAGLVADCDAPLGRDLLTRYVGFPFWDVLTFPVQAVSGVGERDHVEVHRISPRDARLLVSEPGDQLSKLKGVSLYHFGALFSRAGRERDYLWGRLDAAERLVGLLLDGQGRPPTAAAPAEPAPAPEALGELCLPAFRAILDDEYSELVHARDLVTRLEKRVDALASSRPAAAPPGAGGGSD